MKNQIINEIQRKMLPYLNNEQLLHLKAVLEASFQGVIIEMGEEQPKAEEQDSAAAFITAKRIEGCSEKTLAYYSKTIEAMLNGVGKLPQQITTDDLRKYLTDYQTQRHSSKVTIDNIRRILSSFFSWLEDEDFIMKSPVRRIHKVKTAKIIKETYSDEALELMRDNCSTVRDLAIIDLLASSGMRVGELVTLNREDINFNERECVVFGKGNKERLVYFDARTKIHLQNYLDERSDSNPALFVTLKEPHERLMIGGVETMLRELGRRLKLNKVHPHKFRRTLATTAIDKGMPIEQVQQLLGHQKIDTTMHYAILTVTEEKTVTSEFLLSYILPLFAFDFTQWKSVALFLIFFLTLGFLCVKHETFTVNIVLEVFGYQFYRCDLEDEDGNGITWMIISRTDLKGCVGDSVYLRPLNNECRLNASTR